MRSKNAIKNLSTYLAYEILVFLLGLIFPRLIILAYGSEINGLYSTISRILSLINLIQAGAIGTAIYQMYKPVAENDYERQSAILFSAKKYYQIITLVYFGVAVVAGVYYSLSLQSNVLHWYEIFSAFIILAVNGSFSLLFTSICDIYLSPHQKKYLITISRIISQIIYYFCVALTLILKLHFIWIYISILVSGVIGTGINLFFYKKYSAEKINKNPTDKHFKIPDRKYLMMSCVGNEMVTLSPSIIITSFLGLVSSSVFSVYSMIFTSMKTLLSSIQLSFSAIFGNLVKTSDDKHIYDVYSAIELITIVLGTVASAGIGFLLTPFVEIYTRGITDAQYLDNMLVLFVTVYVVTFTFHTSFSYVATVYGLFKYTCKISLFFGLIGIAISVLCVALFGMPYVMIGLIVNQFGCALATLYILKKNVTWFSTKKLILRTFLMIVITAVSYIVYKLVNISISSWGTWVLFGFIVSLTTAALLAIYCLFFEKKYLKMFLKYVKTIFGRKKCQ